MIVSFRYGDPIASTFSRYTDYTDDVIVGADTFTAVPSIAAKIPPYTGGFNEQELVLELPVDAFTGRISNGEPFSPIDVTVVETLEVPSLALTGQHLDTLFKGRVVKAVRNYNKQRGVVGVFAANWKSRIKVALGMPCLNECIWTYGDPKTCQAIPVSVAGQVTAILDNRLTIWKPGAVGPLDPVVDRFWHRGRIVRDGLSLDVKDWSNAVVENPDHFYLDDYAPADWLNQAVTVVEGCSKLIGACRGKSNEARFMGAGIAIPARNPVLEGSA